MLSTSQAPCKCRYATVNGQSSMDTQHITHLKVADWLREAVLDSGQWGQLHLHSKFVKPLANRGISDAGRCASLFCV